MKLANQLHSEIKVAEMPSLTSNIFFILMQEGKKKHSYFPHRGCFREVVTAVSLIYVLQARTEERNLDKSELVPDRIRVTLTEWEKDSDSDNKSN